MKILLTTLTLLFSMTTGHCVLVAQYGFEEGSGSSALDSALSDGTSTPVDDGTIFNAAYVPGKVGSYALQLSGSSSYVLLEPDGLNNDILNNTTGASFTTWIKLDAYPSDIGSIAFFSTSGNSLNSRGGMFISGNGFVEVAGRASDSSSFQSRISSTQISLGEWIHLAGVIDYLNDTISIYIDGELQQLIAGSVSFSGTTTSATDSAASTLGSTAGVFEFLEGSLDDVRIYNHALDAESVLLTIPEPTSTILILLATAFLVFGYRRTRNTDSANEAIHLTPYRVTPRASRAEPRRTSRATARGR